MKISQNLVIKLIDTVANLCNNNATRINNHTELIKLLVKQIELLEERNKEEDLIKERLEEEELYNYYTSCEEN